MELEHKTAVRLMTVLVCVEIAVDSCIVSQPQEIRATFRDSLTLSCTFQVSDNMSRIRVTWFHSSASQVDRVQVSTCIDQDNKGKICKKPASETQANQEVGHNWSILTLSSASLDKQGTYICEVRVEIPTLDNCYGNGTKVIIETLSAAAEGAGWKIWVGVGVGVGAFLLTSMMLGFFIYCWKKRPRDATYANIPRARRPFSQAQSHRQVPDCRPKRATCLNLCQGKLCQVPSPKSLEALTKLGRGVPAQTNSLKT